MLHAPVAAVHERLAPYAENPKHAPKWHSAAAVHPHPIRGRGSAQLVDSQPQASEPEPTPASAAPPQLHTTLSKVQIAPRTVQAEPAAGCDAGHVKAPGAGHAPSGGGGDGAWTLQCRPTVVSPRHVAIVLQLGLKASPYSHCAPCVGQAAPAVGASTGQVLRHDGPP